MSESNEIQEKDENASNANGVEISQFIEKDELFDPTVEMLVNAFDDERTLDEEENIAAIEAEDPDVELLDLQKVIFQFCLQTANLDYLPTLFIKNTSSLKKHQHLISEKTVGICSKNISET